ncbi:MAG: zinc-binding alcohol dehydrogenase [Candidatus Promineofilum sp.]|nr:zinc-binding alcohol dehydrogenase [Promineifilum sp.]
MIKRQSLYFVAPHAAEVREENLSPPGEGEALVQTLVSAVSSGTEMLIYRGQAPAGMTVDETIDALGGAFGFPIKFGYAAAGRVLAVGPDVSPSWIGRMVFAFNPHETHFVAPVAALHPVPDGIEPEDAVFLPNMETAVSFVMDGSPVLGERVAIVGQGVVGLLTTALLGRWPLGGLVAVDLLPRRREWALRLGATAAAAPAEALDALDALPGQRPGAGADLCFELSGNPRALDLAIALTGAYGRIIIGSWYGSKPVEVDLGARFHRAHIRLIGSQVSALAPQWLGRWTKERRLDVAWRMIGQHRPQRLITHRLPIGRAAEGYRLLDGDPSEIVQLVFTYP